MNVTIVDYGMGNIKSIVNALNYLDKVKISIASEPSAVLAADSLILPGVGSFATAMQILKSRGLDVALQTAVVEQKKPILAICLGMQLLVNTSEEGPQAQGLGWIPGSVKKLQCESPLRVPHMGWNDATFDKDSVLFAGMGEVADFYFVHSYHVCCEAEYVTAFCDYGGKIVVALQKEHIFATQFHPEKSHHSGLKVLQNYLDYLAERGTKC